MLNIKQITQNIRLALGADGINELREELRPDHVISKSPVPESRVVGLWCKDKAAADKAADYLRSLSLGYALHFSYCDSKEVWSVRFLGSEHSAQAVIEELEKTV